MTKHTPTLYEAAKTTIEAIEGEDLPTIKKAGKILAKAVVAYAEDHSNRGANQGRHLLLTNEQVRSTMHMSSRAAGAELGVDASTVNRARKRLREGN